MLVRRWVCFLQLGPSRQEATTYSSGNVPPGSILQVCRALSSRRSSVTQGCGLANMARRLMISQYLLENMPDPLGSSCRLRYTRVVPGVRSAERAPCTFGST